MSFPTTLTAGDSEEWETVYPDYSAVDGWTITASLRPIGGGEPVVLTGVGAATTFTFTLTGEQSATLKAGRYQCFAVAKNPDTGGCKTIWEGCFAVTANPLEWEQSKAEKILAQLDAAFQNWLARGTMDSHSVEGISSTWTTPGELQSLRDTWQTIVNSQRQWRIARETGELKIGMPICFG